MSVTPLRRYSGLLVLAAATLALLVGYAREWPGREMPMPTGATAETAVGEHAPVGWYISLAVRRTAGGPPSGLTMPADSRSLVSGRDNPRLRKDFWLLFADNVIAQMSAGNVERREYDPRLSQEEYASLLRRHDVKRYRAFVMSLKDRGGPSGQVVLHTDPKGFRILAVPRSSSPLGGGP